MKILQPILGKYYQNKQIRFIAELFLVIIPTAFIIRTFGFGLYKVPSGSMETTLLVGEWFFADKLSYCFRKPRRGEIISFNDPTYTYSKNNLVNLYQRYASLSVSNWTKRVIGIPGDRIQGKIENNSPVIYLNGEKLDESAYVNKYPLILLCKYPIDSYSRYTCSKSDVDLRSFDPSIKDWALQPFYKIDPSRIILDKDGKPATIYWPDMVLPQDLFDITLKEGQYWVMGDNRKGSADSRMWQTLDEKQIHGKILFRIFSMDSDESWLVFDILKNPIGFFKKIRFRRCLQFVK